MQRENTPQPSHRFSLWQRKLCVVPTWRGWLLACLAAATLTVIGVLRVHPFLALNQPMTGGVLVIEGWLPDYAMKRALELYGTGHYSHVYVTGGPLEYGAPLSEYRTYAEAGATILARLGMDTNHMHAVPAPKVRQDRTFASALELKRWFAEHNTQVTSLTILTEGLHARRSRLLFAKAFGPHVKVGSISVPPESYDPSRWWRSSQGVRGVIGEVLAYIYARFFFQGS